MRKPYASILIAACSASAAFAQTAWKGITPGSSTRTDAERILGAPVRKVSATLSEYRSAGQDDRVYIQFRGDAPVVDRIELSLLSLADRPAIVKALGLPARATASQTNSLGRMEEYFSPALIVLTHDSDAASGITRVGYYSPAIFESLTRDLLPVMAPASSGVAPVTPVEPARIPSPSGRAPTAAPPATASPRPSGAVEPATGNLGGFAVTGGTGGIQMDSRPEASGPTGGAAHPPGGVTLEPNLDRPGSDYKKFELRAADPLQCQAYCRADAQCRAFTYVKPGVQGPAAVCYLKSAAPASRPSDCCTSGIRQVVR